MEFDLQMSRAGFIGLNAMRPMNVRKSSSEFGKITIESLLKGADTKRAPGSAYARRHWEFTDDSYTCKEPGAEEPVDDREAEMYSDYFDAEVLAAERARDIVMRNFEKRVADTLFNATTWSPTSVTTEWSTAATATPVTDVEAGVKRLRAKGVKANALIIGWVPYRNLRLCSQITDIIAASGAGGPIEPSVITPQKLAEIFDLDYVLVGDAQEDTADEGLAASLGEIWDDEYAAVCRIATTDNIRETCVGRTFHHSSDGSQIGALVESYRDETVRSDVVRARMDTDEQVLHTVALDLLDNITA